MKQENAEWRFVVIWEFKVRPDQEGSFERTYGVNGAWAQFFRKDEAYIGTELIRDLKEARTYLTLDFWRSQEAYDAFRARHAEEYGKIDKECESLTEGEREVGRYNRTVAG
ncbi:MAG: antibiotic biosynthesis monooxygenase family protein [Terriglobales bacterium]